MPVVGTAGHVDHGKSTLVRALTGRDPDRWKEEKDRGLTIDLGFAWATLPSGIEVSFVDVPGHERFMKNMLAGVDGIDVALLVVAADEGWMPQSEEHLAVLDLLEVRRGVVAITKVDRVEPDLAELAALEARERLEGTSLEGAAVVPVSALDGTGLNLLIGEVEAALSGLTEGDLGDARLWIDRSFTISGAGTVVTGTLLGGPLRVDDTVEIWPGVSMARIRSLESHERRVPTVQPGRRVAANLVGVNRSDLRRGAMLGKPGRWAGTSRLLVRFRTARYEAELTDRGAYHAHIGSGVWPARLRVLEQRDGAGVAVVELGATLPLRLGDRLLIRDTGRRSVVAGGRVLDPAPSGKRRDLLRAAEMLGPALGEQRDERAQVLLDLRGVASAADIASWTGGGEAAGAVRAGRVVASAAAARDVRESVHRALAAFHAENPLRPGMSPATLASALAVDRSLLTAVLEEDDQVEIQADWVALPSARSVQDPTQDEAWVTARDRLRDEAPLVPRVEELGLDVELVHALERVGALVRIAPDLVMLPNQVEQLLNVARTLGDGFTVSEFREAAALTRKYAVPFLEWADSTGRTVREGDRRRLRD